MDGINQSGHECFKMGVTYGIKGACCIYDP
jgi:hypothetical protein